MTATVVTEPGVYEMDEVSYHLDPVPDGSLSASGAKKLLACPARFDYDRRHPPAPTAAMELGTAAHKLVLGKGAELVVIEAENYRGKAAQSAPRTRGRPGRCRCCRTTWQVRRWPRPSASIPSPGRCSTRSTATRSRACSGRTPSSASGGGPGWTGCPAGRYGRRMVVPDLKSCTSAAPAAIAKAVANLGYYVQAAWYVDAVEALGLADDPAFLLVFLDRAPY